MIDSLKRILDQWVPRITGSDFHRCAATKGSFRLIQPNIRFRFVAKYLYQLEAESARHNSILKLR